MSTLEVIRGLHEEIEAYQRGMVAELNRTPEHILLRTEQSMRVKHYMDRIAANSARLKELYADKDALRGELDSLSGDGPNVYSLFYERLREAKENYRKYPRTVPPPDKVLQFAPAPDFTGAESFGRFLDLTELHEQYINLLVSFEVFC